MSAAVHEVVLASLAAIECKNALFEKAPLERVLESASTLPAVFSSIGLEARLVDDNAHLDFGVCVEREQAELLSPVASGACQAFLARWTDRESVLWRAVPHAWFEFDVPSMRAADACSAWSTAFPFARLSDGTCSPETTDSLCRILGELGGLGKSATPEHARQLFDAFPKDAYVFHASALHHRGANELRVEFAARARGLLVWLESWGVPADSYDLLHFVLEELPIRQVAVQLSSVEGELRPHSIELDLGHGGEQDPIWSALFDALQRADLASANKLRALAEWPGGSLLRLASEPLLVRVTRSFHVTLKLGARLEAKAYPYFTYGYALC